MKMITLIIALSFCVTSYGLENWFPVGKEGADTVYPRDKAKCESREEYQCFDIQGKDLRFHKLVKVSEDDKSKPIWKEYYSVESCSDMAECQEIAETKICDDEAEDTYRIIENKIMPGYSIVCTRVTGYEQIESKKLVLDETKRGQVIAEDLAKQQTNSAVAAVRKQMECGKNIQASMALRNISKGLTTDQVNTFVQTYSTVKNLLDSGALKTAKAQLESITPDGTITTAEDKTAIIGLINTCLGE